MDATITKEIKRLNARITELEFKLKCCDGALAEQLEIRHRLETSLRELGTKMRNIFGSGHGWGAWSDQEAAGANFIVGIMERELIPVALDPDYVVPPIKIVMEEKDD
jgi:hypothetical protein